MHTRMPIRLHMIPRSVTRRFFGGAIAAAATAATLLTIAGCSIPYHHTRGSDLGVLPPQPPKPLWLGAVRPQADSTLHGAAAVTLSTTPHWSHVLVSVSGATPSVPYTWRLRSGRCTDSGPALGPDERYAPLIPFADGTGRSESTIPEILTPSTPYSITVTGPSGATTAPSACADLTYGTM